MFHHRNKSVPVLLIAGMALGCAPDRAPAREPAARPPNIVVILGDDVGYGDLGCYGATAVKTPHLDKLAAEGLRFTDAHTPSVMCTPTRYSMLTGEYAFRHPPVARGVLSGVAPLAIRPGRATLPSILKEAGYDTGVVGKWHLGLGEGETDYNGEIRPGPLEVGFDHFFGYPATNDRVPCVYIENRRVVGLDPKDPLRVSYGKKVGDDPTGKERPDLLKLHPVEGHDGTIVNGISRIGFMSGGKAARWVDEEMADVLTARAVRFIEENQKRPFFLYFAPADVHVPRTPHPRWVGTSPHGTRGAVLHELDGSVGGVLAAIDRLGLAPDTLVLFSSDNGGARGDGYDDGFRDDKSGHRCNGPLRGYKGGVFEGGHRVPFIVRWPGRVKPGVSAELVSLIDFPAAFAALAGRTLPADAAPDSINVLPALLGEGPSARDHLVSHAGSGAFAIRKGPWKLVPSDVPDTKRDAELSPLPPKHAAGRLFNLTDDVGESDNLADKNPEKVKELSDLLRRIRENGRSRP